MANLRTVHHLPVTIQNWQALNTAMTLNFEARLDVESVKRFWEFTSKLYNNNRVWSWPWTLEGNLMSKLSVPYRPLFPIQPLSCTVSEKIRVKILKVAWKGGIWPFRGQGHWVKFCISTKWFNYRQTLGWVYPQQSFDHQHITIIESLYSIFPENSSVRKKGIKFAILEFLGLTVSKKTIKYMYKAFITLLFDARQTAQILLTRYLSFEAQSKRSKNREWVFRFLVPIDGLRPDMYGAILKGERNSGCMEAEIFKTFMTNRVLFENNWFGARFGSLPASIQWKKSDCLYPIPRLLTCGTHMPLIFDAEIAHEYPEFNR